MRTSNIYIYIIFLAAIFTGCKEETRDGLDDAPDKAKVAFLNLASPARLGSPNLTAQRLGYFYYIDNILQFSQPLISNRTNGYRLVDPGPRTLRFDTVLAVTNNVAYTTPSAPVKSVNITAEANKYYSVYLSGNVQAPTELVTTDDLTRPAEGKAKIRFVHLSPDAPAVDFAGVVSPTGATISNTVKPVIFGNRSYNTSTEFISIDVPQSIFYDFQLRAAGTTNIIPTASENGAVIPRIGNVQPTTASPTSSFTVLIEPGKIYTFIARGYANPLAPGLPPVFPLSVTGVVNSYF